MSEYLKHKKQPWVDTMFYERYHLELSKASALLKQFHEEYKRQNPWCKISYERSYSPELLTMFFEHAAKDYESMEKRITNGNCDRIPLHHFMAAVCKVPVKTIEDMENGRK